METGIREGTAHPVGLRPKAEHAVVRTRPTRCVLLTLNGYSILVGGWQIVISIVTKSCVDCDGVWDSAEVEVGAAANVAGTLSCGRNFGCGGSILQIKSEGTRKAPARRWWTTDTRIARLFERLAWVPEAPCMSLRNRQSWSALSSPIWRRTFKRRIKLWLRRV